MTYLHLKRLFVALSLTAAFTALLSASARREDPPENVTPQVVVMRTVRTEPPQQTTRLLTGGTAYREGERGEMTLMGDSPYLKTVDAESLLIAPYDFTFEQDGPAVLIVHTHTTEAYTPCDGWQYEPSGDYRTLDKSQSIVRVGAAIADALAARGIEALHDTNVYDRPSFSQAYNTALPQIQKTLAEHPSVRIVLDVHRDAYAVGGEQQAYLTELDGEPSAQILLVVGDGGNYDYDGWRQNLKWTLKVYAAANRAAPNLVRTLRLDHARYNQHLMPGSMLVEVGSAGNTLPQALCAARAFADALADVIDGLKTGY